MDTKYNPESRTRWGSPRTLKLIIFAWMANDINVVFSPSELAHNSPTFLYMVIHMASVIFVGIPLVYSEMCVVQYAGSSAVTMWDLFPLFRGVGYGTYFLVLLKAVHTLVLASWYLDYTFFSALSPPPWSSCDDMGGKCMVKMINTSTFQHCLEMSFLFNDDCGIKTASSVFFDQEIGDNTMYLRWPQCMYPWKILVASSSIIFIVFVLSLKNNKYIRFIVKFVFTYVNFVVFALFCVALSTCGAWYSSKMTNGINWENTSVDLSFLALTRGFLSLGTGTGVAMHFYKGSSFRSPVNMLSITVPLLTVMVSLLYTIVNFSGIKNMSFYHGEENVMEVPYNTYFIAFSSTAELLSYFSFAQVITFCWFSSIFLCLFLNEWLSYLYLRDAITEAFPGTTKWLKVFSLFSLIILFVLALPFFCSDITPALTDATSVIQAISSLFVSISIYWFYGYKNHNIDIIFMIGVKASYFWKLAWLVNPIFISIIVYFLFENLHIYDEELHNMEIEMEYYKEILPIPCDELVFYTLLGTYLAIVISVTFKEIISYCRRGKLKQIFSPTENWGPTDTVLAKSRSMFVPEIMTREFLYRQVKIHGYCKTQKTVNKQIVETASNDTFSDQLEWSVLTSN